MVVGTAGYLTLIGVLGGMLGWIVRSTPGAPVAYFSAVLVLPVIFGNVLGPWGKDIAQFMPSNAGGSFALSLPKFPHLSPAVGFVVLLAWVFLAIVVAVAQLIRRDAERAVRLAQATRACTGVASAARPRCASP